MRELSLRCAGAAQREQQDFTREQLVSLHPPGPCIQLRLSNLHSSPKSFPHSLPSWRSRCQTLKSKASSCFHHFMALSAPTSCFPFSSPPPPGKERPSPLALGPDPYVSVQVPLFFVGDGYQRPAWSPGGVAWAPRGELLASGLRGLTLLAAGDPFIALSTVNLSALLDAFTSFFICSSF